MDPFVVQKLTLLVLRPDIFLPDNQPLSILNAVHRTFRNPGGDKPPKALRSSWTSFYSEPNGIWLLDSSNQWFSEFDFTSRRQSQDSISAFAMLVNANSKLQNIMRTPQYPELEGYAYAVKNAVDAIFHVPENAQPVPTFPAAHSPNITIPGPSSKSGRDTRDGGVDEGHSDFANDFDKTEEYSSEEDDEPDTINGLTFPEMKTVLQRVSDGTISDRERAEAAMLMLGMAGCEFFVPFTLLL